VETVARYAIYFFQSFSPFAACGIIQNNTLQRSNGILQNTHGENGVYVVIVEIIDINKIVKEYIRFYYVSVGQVSQPTTVLICHVITESNASPLLSGGNR
jgi:hypothetical protein